MDKLQQRLLEMRKEVERREEQLLKMRGWEQVKGWGKSCGHEFSFCLNDHRLKLVEQRTYNCDICYRGFCGRSFCCPYCNFDCCPHCITSYCKGVDTGLTSAKKCPTNHNLRKFTNCTYICNVHIGSTAVRGNSLYCSICDYDCCPKCEKASGCDSGEKGIKKQCPEGHPLKRYVNRNYICNLHSGSLRGSFLYCITCDFDCCPSCEKNPLFWK